VPLRVALGDDRQVPARTRLRQPERKAQDSLDAGADYGYDQIIVIGCTPDDLYIEATFPKILLPEGVNDVPYNPFGRILPGFIPPERVVERIVADVEATL